jgi:uncharacterized membrane protein YraQ (UPF0718 family)
MLEIITAILTDVWRVLLEMSPFLLFGFFFAGLLAVLVSPEGVERQLGGSGLWPVVKATLFGIPLPLCSCSVIPVTASLRRHGASRGASTAFLLSAPQTGVDSILVTYSLLGSLFAVFRPLAALLAGILGGSLVTAAESGEERDRTLAQPCEEECCALSGDHGRGYRAVRFGFVTLPKDIGKPLLIGILVAGFISSLIPEDFFSGIIGTGFGAMVVMMLLGIPVYVCATASIPVAAALIAKGVSPGAALVFLTTGAATNTATIATAWKMMGGRTALIYLATVVVTAFASGMALDYLFRVSGAPATPPSTWMMPGFIKIGAAVALLVILAYAFFHREPAHND